MAQTLEVADGDGKDDQSIGLRKATNGNEQEEEYEEDDEDEDENEDDGEEDKDDDNDERDGFPSSSPSAPAPRSQHIFEEKDSLEQMLENEEFLRFIDKENAVSGRREDEQEQRNKEEQEHEFTLSSDSASNLPDVDDDVQSQSTIGLSSHKARARRMCFQNKSKIQWKASLDLLLMELHTPKLGHHASPILIACVVGAGIRMHPKNKQVKTLRTNKRQKKRAEKRADAVEGQGDASKESAEVPLKPEPAMNKDIEDAEKSSEKPTEKDTIVNLSNEDADLLILDVYGEILGCRKKNGNTEERAILKKKAKVAYEPPKPTLVVELIFSPVSPAKWTIVAIEVQEINEMEELSWIGDVQEPDKTVEDIAAKQDADVTLDKVEEDHEPAICLEIEEILPNCLGWGYLVSNFCKIKKLIILDLNGLFVKQYVSKRDPKTGQLEHPPRLAFNRVNIKRVNEKLWIYYHRDVEQFVWDLRHIVDAMIWSSCTAANIELILHTYWPDIWEHRTGYFRYLFSDWQCEKWSYFEEIAKAPRDLVGKRLFFKLLHHVWNKFPEYDSSRTLLVDDSRYKNMRNV
ncbi:hypothetical protein L7F22_034331 [Adiantum nelumboides]|nr:hypothetical protein [Adiantum nelumboides]